MKLIKNKVLKKNYCEIRITVILVFIILILNPAIGIEDNHSASQSNSVKISRLASDIKISTESGDIFSSLVLPSESLSKPSNHEINSSYTQEDKTGESLKQNF